jgi:DNA-binding XRE family transcriptional regulator
MNYNNISILFILAKLKLALPEERPGRTGKSLNRQIQMRKNFLKKTRESLMMSKAELARKANISPITITRIEQGKPARMETKRKIILALGYKLSDKHKIFND